MNPLDRDDVIKGQKGDATDSDTKDEYETAFQELSILFSIPKIQDQVSKPVPKIQKVKPSRIMRKRNQKLPREIAKMTITLYRVPLGYIIFTTTVKGKFKIEEENSTVDAIQELITKLEEEKTKTKNWSGIFKHYESSVIRERI